MKNPDTPHTPASRASAKGVQPPTPAEEQTAEAKVGRPKKTPESVSMVRNQDMMQSYVLTTARYDFSLYEKRILYRLVERAQCFLKGEKNLAGRKVNFKYGALYEMEMPVRCILSDEDDKNYIKAKTAFKALTKKDFTYEDEHVWSTINILLRVDIDKRLGTAHLLVDERIWECCLNFAKGFRKYELRTAMKLKSVYSMRLYEMISNKKEPVTYTIVSLKERFMVENKYKQVNDFMKRVIIPAQRELDGAAPWSFDYEFKRRGRKIEAITLIPRKVNKNEDEDLEEKRLLKKLSMLKDITPDFNFWLQTYMYFEKSELKNNRQLLAEAEFLLPDLKKIRDEIRKRALTLTLHSPKSNPKGYFINAIKSEVEAAKTALLRTAEELRKRKEEEEEADSLPIQPFTQWQQPQDVEVHEQDYQQAIDDGEALNDIMDELPF